MKLRPEETISEKWNEKMKLKKEEENAKTAEHEDETDVQAAYDQLKKDLFDETKNPRTQGGDETVNG